MNDTQIFIVDIEADGPIPGHDQYSMLEIGAIHYNTGDTFHTRIYPISLYYKEEIYEDILKYTRADAIDNGIAPTEAMSKFRDWVLERTSFNTKTGKPSTPRYISDNNGFDWMFTHWYFIEYLNHDPFGYSSMNLSSLVSGVHKDIHTKWKHLRKTPHTHNPVDDALGNVEILRHLIEHQGLKI